VPIGDTVPVSAEQLQVAADDFRITSADTLLRAQLRSSMVVCLYDAVGESGAMLHLRLAAPGQSRDPNLTDNTLSGNLSLLTRALRELSATAPRAQHWQARLVAQSEDHETARARCEGLQAFIGEFLKDAGIRLVSAVAHLEPEVSVQFRPAMGQVQTLTAGSSNPP